MAFVKKTWSDGDSVHASDFNRIQTGIQEAITASGSAGGITTDDALEAVEDAGYIKGIATLTINNVTFDGTENKTVTISGSGGTVDIPVQSVNGKTGAVVLKTSDLTNDSGFITSSDIPSGGSSIQIRSATITPIYSTAMAANAKVTVPVTFSSVFENNVTPIVMCEKYVTNNAGGAYGYIQVCVEPGSQTDEGFTVSIRNVRDAQSDLTGGSLGIRYLAIAT